MRVLINDQMKIVEQRAAEKGLEFIRLMENAGSACTRITKEQIPNNVKSSQRITIVSGSGKNGGDGFVIARKLCEAGYTVNIILADGFPKDKDSIEMFEKLKSLSIKIIQYDFDKLNAVEMIMNSEIIVDSVFGTGFKGIPNDEISFLFGLINSCSAKVFSVDIPSGVICNTGEIPGENVNADVTIAISSLKPAHVLVPGSISCGKLIVADIGIPESCYDGIDEGVFYTYCESEVKLKIPAISPIAHKGTFGHILSICGSKNMQGAAVIAAKGATYSGAGLVTAAFPDCAYPAIGSKLTEQLLLPLNSNELGTISISALPKILEAAQKADVVLIGCGIGVNSDTIEILREVVSTVTCPVVIDADGINALSTDINMLKKANNSVIITPHPGEMAKLNGLSISQIQSQRITIAKDCANELGVTVVLKGANTVVAEPFKDSVYVNSTGNPGMATGGSGDLLAGIISSFIAQGIKEGEAAKAGVFIHGDVGDFTAKRLSKRGLTPSACLEDLPFIMAKFEQ